MRVARPASIGLLAACLALGGAGHAHAGEDRAVVNERARLIVARHAAMVAQARATALEAKARAARNRADATRAAIEAVQGRIRVAEADVAATEARARMIEALRRQVRARLASQQGSIVKLAAALQTMALRPPALALAQPGSLDDLIHVRALLETTLPAVRARTAGLRAEIARAEQLRRQAGRAATALRASRYALDRQRLALVNIEGEQRARAGTLEGTAQDQGERALALGERARDIVDEMQEMGSAGDVAAALAKLPAPLPRPLSGSAAAPSDRHTARYALPVAGNVANGYGEVSDAGVSARGITFTTDPDDRVRAPASGRVLYAGAFLHYGSIVILDHGGGWTTTLTGLARLRVAAGDTVAKGATLGRAGDDRPRVTVELRRGGRPIDIGAMFAAG